MNNSKTLAPSASIETAVLRLMNDDVHIVDTTNAKVYLSDGTKWNSKSFNIYRRAFAKALDLSIKKDPLYKRVRKKILQMRLQLKLMETKERYHTIKNNRYN